jgi:NADH:ubiquinone oxidoreductase subunit 6 (subunit J)
MGEPHEGDDQVSRLDFAIGYTFLIFLVSLKYLFEAIFTFFFGVLFLEAGLLSFSQTPPMDTVAFPIMLGAVYTFFLVGISSGELDEERKERNPVAVGCMIFLVILLLCSMCAVTFHMVQWSE